MNSNDRHIAHFDLDTFFVSVECLLNPKLKGKPVLVGGSSERGVVASCSYEARKFGIHSAMPMYMAKRLCNEAIIVKGDYEAYSKYSHLVTDVIRDTVPLFEKSSIDEFYIDMTGMDKFFGCSLYTAELKAKVIKETGLPISYALATNKLISKVATNEVKPNGQLEIMSGKEKIFLNPLKVMKLPGIGEKTGVMLLKMGVETIKVLSEIPIPLMTNLLGKNGAEIHRRANAIDESPVIPFHEQKSIGTENTFQQDTTDLKFLHTELVRMTEKISFQLRSQNKLTGCVSIKIRYTDFDTHLIQKTIAYSNQDHVLIKTVKELFEKLNQRRILIRLIGVRFTNLIPGNYQINLFDDTQEVIGLYKAIDSIKKQYGEKFIMKAGGI